MSFDPVSYAAGRKAGGGGREPALETLFVTENGTYTPEPPAEGFSGVQVSVPSRFSPLADQAGAGDLRYGAEAYDDQGNVIAGTLRNLHRPIPVYWDNANARFTVTQDMLAQIVNTISEDGAVTGYLVNSETGIPIPCVVHPDESQNIILTGGVCIVDGSDTDKYVVYAQIGSDGTVSNEKCSLIRLAVTVSRHLSDWMADGEYLSLFLLA